MKKLPLFLLLAITLVFSACEDKYPDLEDGVYAEIITNHGTFVAKLYNDATPLTIANFVSLAEGTNDMVDSIYKGKPFYNGLTFHRVMKDFMIQGGDPSGDGTGNPGYRFPDEFVDSLKHDRKGILSMANGGPETNGSQFFVTLKETPWLNGDHTIFGEVVIGMDVVEAIGQVPTKIPGDKPLEAVIMEQVNIIKKGKVDVLVFANELKKIEDVRKKAQERLENVAIDKAVEFATNKKDAEKMESGLMMYYTNKGNGRKPKNGEDLLINYAGYFTNGQLFNTNLLEIAEAYEQVDQTRKATGRYEPIISNTTDDRLIPGFREALQTMRIGDKATIYIPSHLGYGEQGNRPFIPPNTDLIFELEMLDSSAKKKE